MLRYDTSAYPGVPGVDRTHGHGEEVGLKIDLGGRTDEKRDKTCV